MHRKIRYCASCKRYTMSHTCPECGKETLLAGPPKFSPEDRFGEYRRRAKIEQTKKE